MPGTKQGPKEAIDLKEACVRAAHEVIAERGVEQLSLRDVARRLKVSHQAPYKHYPSREHLLAEVVRRCFESFAHYLDGRAHAEDPQLELRALGERYLEYAATHPLEYRLMFGTPWPGPAVETGLVRDAVHAFDILRGVLRRVHGSVAAQRARVDLDAMFIWVNMHGLASIGQSGVMAHLGLAPTVGSKAPAHVMAMMSAALSATHRPPG
ncbi:TetR/AcrR family transcriptional regulator [Rivibacter subsaxonicus]|uniref:TetR family transcriptional regulator n=1 Tax=Rivibacter subsaxonicus TaxID=457575 RepID=A0A4Q7VDF0_9BURK|nr:TetR/AcrR family transcriptional regulator [Rivibacter subsaxonicus]RZT93750.1 TetR family transcriptional regulator [Rivibacter subsaxonicus]